MRQIHGENADLCTIHSSDVACTASGRIFLAVARVSFLAPSVYRGVYWRVYPRVIATRHSAPRLSLTSARTVLPRRVEPRNPVGGSRRRPLAHFVGRGLRHRPQPRGSERHTEHRGEPRYSAWIEDDEPSRRRCAGPSSRSIPDRPAHVVWMPGVDRRGPEAERRPETSAGGSATLIPEGRTWS